MKTSLLLEKLDRTPMLRALVPLAAGILAADAFTLPLWFLTGAFLVAGVLALLLRSQLCAVAMLFAAGFALSGIHRTRSTTPHDVYTIYELSVEGISSDRGRYSSCEGIVRSWRDPADGSWHAARDRVMLYADSLVQPLVGERLYCRGSVRTLRGGVESYRDLMARRGFVGSLWVSERALLRREAAQRSSLHAGAVDRMARLDMDAGASAVCRAMVTGDRSGITPELRAVYSRSGLAHLLAVSGLHTGIVFMLVNLLLWWMPLLRRGHLWRNLLATAAIWLYVAAAGFAPSAVRAAVMCTLLQFALASASHYVAVNALATAAFGMLLWNPAWLGDISFRLSFVAVAAILVWGVPLCRRLHTRFRAVNILVDALAISLVCAVATAPLVSHTFGIVPIAGLMVNPVAIGLGTVVVFGGAIWMLVPFGWLAPVFEFTLSTATGALNALARCVAELPYGVAEYALGAEATVGIYLFFVVATAVGWASDTKKPVHLPA